MKPYVATIHHIALSTRRLPLAARYAITTGIVAMVGLLSLKWGHSDQRYPFLIFFPVIFACGVLLDRGNGFLATGLSALFCGYFLLPPFGSSSVGINADQFALALFLLIGFGHISRR